MSLSIQIPVVDNLKMHTTSRKSAFICLSSTTTLAETAAAFVAVPPLLATIISVSNSCTCTEMNNVSNNSNRASLFHYKSHVFMILMTSGSFIKEFG